MRYGVKYLLCLSFMAGLWPSPSAAQTFPEKENNVVVYYRLVSACPDYAARMLCLQDVTSTQATYNYTLAEYDATAKQQDWVFQTADAEAYNLRNRRSNRYISAASAWVEDYLTPGYAMRKAATDALTFTPIGDNQYTISYQSDGLTYYLAATDVSAAPMVMPKERKDTPWAWHIYKAAEMESGVLEAYVPEEVIMVNNRRISVAGATQWRIYDVQGREYSPEEALAPGVYMVKAPRTTKKVIVKP